MKSLYVKDFVLEIFDTTEDEFFRALIDSNVIVYKNGMLCMMSDDYIHYFGALPEKRRTKEFLAFFKEFDLKGKDFYSKDTKMYDSLLKNGIINQINQ